MVKETLTYRGSGRQYLHRDFHGALSVCLDYLHRHLGAEAVRDYLGQFALSFYAPLREKIKKEGLAALKEHFEKIYSVEGGRIQVAFTGSELVLRVEDCPALGHMKTAGFAVSELFFETDRTLYGALCEGTGFGYEMLEYDRKTGRSAHRFYRLKKRGEPVRARAARKAGSRNREE